MRRDGSVNVARLLISYGAQVNVTADNAHVPVMAAREGHAQMVTFLLATRRSY